MWSFNHASEYFFAFSIFLFRLVALAFNEEYLSSFSSKNLPFLVIILVVLLHRDLDVIAAACLNISLIRVTAHES